MSEHKMVGKRMPRIDAVGKVTGEVLYTGDVTVPGVLYAKFLGSPHSHARIRRIDVTAAERMSGVKAVLTYDRLAERWPMRIGDPSLAEEVAGEFFAHEKVRYEGERVAVVVATDPDLAEDAAERIEVEYEVLPAVFDVMEAIRPDAPLVHEGTEPVTTPDGRTLYNVGGQSQVEHGNVDRAFREADVVVEDTYRVPRVKHTYMEPDVILAEVDIGGKVTVRTSTQGIFDIRSSVASTLGIPLSDVNVIGMTMGGGFGGKFGLMIHPCAALLAGMIGRPVLISMTRREDLLHGRPAPGCVANMRTAARRDGTITAREIEMFWDGGISGSGGNPARIWELYKVSNVRYRGYSVYTNKPGSSAYRAPSSPQVTLPSEAQLDHLAEALRMDPLELRLKNMVETGDTIAGGGVVPKVGYKETLQRAADHVNWADRSKGPNQGWGVAIGEWTNGAGPCGALLNLREDGGVHLVYGMMDITGSDTSMAQIVAEVLDVPWKRVYVRRGDTDSVPYSVGSGGSVITFSVGTTVKRAAEDARRRILKIASEALDVDAEGLELRDGNVVVRDDPDTAMTLAEVANSAIRSPDGPVVGYGTFPNVRSGPVISAQILHVEVDPETGAVRVVRFANAQDVGRAINPMSVEGQMEGASVQGLSWGWMEEMQYGNGRNLNPNLTDYRIPTASDVPTQESLIVEIPWEHGPYGAKGVGEPPITPTLAAFANAVSDAIGARANELPLTPERIVRVKRRGAQRHKD